jgi:Protein of unknown function, DUF547
MGIWWTRLVILNDEVYHEVQEFSTPVALSKSVRKIILSLKGTFIDEHGLKVNYGLMKGSELYSEYKHLVSRLRSVDMALLSSDEKKAFLINIYNGLIIHALVEGLLSSFPGGTLSRLQLYASAAYRIGDGVYSLNDIENGLLRGNRKPPVPFAGHPFPLTPGSDENRLDLVLECDPRIHFALNCGAKGCPPISVYSSDQINTQLDVATRGFLEQGIVVDLVNGTITVSMLFSWYAEDFGGTDAAIIDWIRAHTGDPLAASITELCKQCAAKGRNPKLLYEPYDWSLND